MKKNKKLAVILIVMILLLTGCTKYLSDDNNKRIINEVTGQNLTSNILCLPEDEDLINIYNENRDNMDVDFDSLKPCSEYKPSNIKYKGLWESIIIKPLAFIIVKLGLLVKNYGLSVIILGILIKLILFPFTKKTLTQSEKMKKAQPELQAIQKKYANVTDNSASMQMSQEMMMVYNKYGINPAGGCLISFIQIPILLGFLEAINRVPAIFEGSFLTLQLGTTPFAGIKSGNYYYIILIVLIILTTYLSFKYSMSNGATGNKDQDKQMEFMMKFMIVFISIASLSLPTALALYWIVSNGFTIIQTFIMKKMNKDDKRVNTGKVKKTKKEEKISDKAKEVKEESPKVDNKKSKKNTKKKRK